MLYNTVRPHSFESMVGQKDIVNNIRKQAQKGKFFQVYVLGGHFGCGKTTMARIIAEAVNCDNKDENGNPCCQCDACKEIISGSSPDVIEIDAASNTGVDNIRDLKESSGYLPLRLKKKVYIIDEVHMLSTGAFNALLKVLEEPPEHVMFILCTTEVKKIPATVRSRAACYQFAQISQKDMVPYLMEVADEYDYKVTEEAAKLIARNSQGAMRNALSLLEQAAEMGDITEEVVSSMLGISDPSFLFKLLDTLVVADVSGSIKLVNELFEGGKDPYIMVNDLLDILSDSISAFYTGVDDTLGSETYCSEIEKVLSGSTPDTLCAITDSLMDIRDQLRTMPEKTTLVCGLIGMMSNKDGMIISLEAKVKALEARLSALEEGKVTFAESKEKQIKQIFKTEEVKETAAETETVETDKAEKVSVDTETEENTVEVEVEEEKEEVPADEPDEKETETVEDKEPETVSEEISEEDVAENNMMAAAFGFGFGFSFGAEEVSKAKTKEEASAKTEAADMSEKETVMSVAQVEEYVENLCKTDNFLANIFNGPFSKSIEGDKVVYITNKPHAFKMLQCYEKDNTENGYPFEYKLAD